MIGLLTHTIQRIDSLEQFYQLEYKNIERKSKKGTNENRFGMLIDVYLNALTYADEEYKNTESFKALEKLMKKCVEVKNFSEDDNKKTISFTLKKCKYIKDTENFDVRKKTVEYQKYAEMPQIHSSNTLIMLIVRFEEFISNFITSIFLMFPDKYLNNKCVHFSEIEDLGTEEIKENIIIREVEGIMHQSYTEWFKLFESHKMSFEQCKEEMLLLREIYARRNILVHNSGRVNNIYLKNVRDSKYKSGDLLTVDNTYLVNAFATIKTLIFAIIIESNKFNRDDKANLLDEVFGQGFEEMSKEHYSISAKVFDILQSIKSQSEQDRLASKVNYWISTKEIYGLSAIRKELDDFDTTALNTMFCLAKQLLLDDYDNATKSIEYMLSKDEINATIINDWPLFKNYRATSNFEELKTRNKEKFNLTILEPESSTEKPDISIRSELNEIGNE